MENKDKSQEAPAATQEAYIKETTKFLAESFRDIAAKYPGQDLKGAIEKLVKYGYKKRKTGEELFNTYKQMSPSTIHQRMDVMDVREVIDKELGFLRNDLVPLKVNQLIGHLSERSVKKGEPPLELAAKYKGIKDMAGLEAAINEAKPHKNASYELTEDQRKAKEHREKLAKEIGEAMWPGLDCSRDMDAMIFTSRLAKKSIANNTDFCLLIKKFYGMPPSVARAEQDADMDIAKERNDSRSEADRQRAADANANMGKIKDAIWKGVEYDSDMSAFVAKAGWYCVRNNLNAEEFAKEFQGKSGAEALEAFKGKYEHKKQQNPADAEKARREARQRYAALAAEFQKELCPRNKVPSDEMARLCQGLAGLAVGMGTAANVKEMAAPYKAMRCDDAEKLEAFEKSRNSKAQSQENEGIAVA